MEIVRALQAFASPTLNEIMFTITNLGSERAYIVFILIAYLGINARVGQQLGIALTASFYLNFLLKGLIDTPRPYLIDESVNLGERYTATGLGPGFPSGHAQGSATFWGLAAARVRTPLFWAITALIVLLISLSRIYFGLHLPIDVVGGVIIGAGIVLITLGVVRWRERVALSHLLIVGLGIAVPFALHIVMPLISNTFVFNESDLLLGGLAAFITGPTLLRHQAGGTWWQRVTLVLLGIVLVFAFLIGSSLLLPEAIKRNPVGGFVRYLTLGYVGVLLTPWLGRHFGIALKPDLEPDQPRAAT